MVVPVMVAKRLVEADLNDPEKENHIDQAAEKQRHHKSIVVGLNGPENQIPLAKKTAGGRHPNDGQSPNHKGPHGERHFRKQPFQVLKGIPFEFIDNVAHNQEGAQGHEGVVYNMEDRPCHSRPVSKPRAANHIADFRNNDIS